MAAILCPWEYYFFIQDNANAAPVLKLLIMRFIPTKIHGLLDYLTAIALVFAPFYFWTTEMGGDFWVPFLIGAGTIIYSVWTDYEWGAFRALSMRTHLKIDLAAGIFLAASPWLLGFADLVFWPHLIIGLFEIAASLLTQTEPSRKGVLGPNTL